MQNRIGQSRVGWQTEFGERNKQYRGEIGGWRMTHSVRSIKAVDREYRTRAMRSEEKQKNYGKWGTE
jgi:hypothetical protein